MKYFAYGSNMLLDLLERRVGPVQRIGIAILEDYEMKFTKIGKKDGTGKGNIHSAVNERVYGILYELSEEQIQLLDESEGVPIHYRRQSFIVLGPDSQKVSAEAYIATDSMTSSTPIAPTKEYLGYIVDGCIENKVPVEIISKITRTAQSLPLPLP